MSKSIINIIIAAFCFVFLFGITPAKATLCCQYSSTCAVFNDADINFCLNGSPAGSLQIDSKCVKNKCVSNSTGGGSGESPAAGNYGLNAAAGAAGINTSGSVAGITGKIIGVVLSLVGIAFFLLMLYGGFLWMTARGEEAQAKKAKDIIIDAVIGIIIVAAAGIITSFVFTSVVPK